jgi:hypothetical protein
MVILHAKVGWYSCKKKKALKSTENYQDRQWYQLSGGLGLCFFAKKKKRPKKDKYVNITFFSGVASLPSGSAVDIWRCVRPQTYRNAFFMNYGQSQVCRKPAHTPVSTSD